MPRGHPGSGMAAIVELKCSRCGLIRRVKAKQLAAKTKMCRSCAAHITQTKRRGLTATFLAREEES